MATVNFDDAIARRANVRPRPKERVVAVRTEGDVGQTTLDKNFSARTGNSAFLLTWRLCYVWVKKPKTGS